MTYLEGFIPCRSEITYTKDPMQDNVRTTLNCGPCGIRGNFEGTQQGSIDAITSMKLIYCKKLQKANPDSR